MGADRHFRRFVATGDPEALGRVFDAVAPKLLLAATHLARKGAEAEDLVQATFLRAIEGAKTFDPKRRLMPWLVGILTNEARMANRRSRREADPERMPAQPPALDPQDAAAAKELDDALARRLEALPKRYRSVLTFKLVHGLSPLEIAHALELPPETVKSRIRRGLKMLRAALPAGHAVGLAAVALPAGGLAASRIAVLGQVPPVSATAVGFAGTVLSLGGMLIKKAAILGVCVLCTGVVGVGLWGVLDEPPAQGPRGEANEQRLTVATQEQHTEPERQPLAGLVNIPRPAWRLEGRVVDSEERPIPGALVELTADRSGVRGVVTGRSMTDGHYFVDLSPWQKRSRFENGHVTLNASVRAPGFLVLPASMMFGDQLRKSSDRTELVLKRDFELHKGGVLTGLVVSPDGDPVADASIHLHVGKSKSTAHTNAQGRYQVNVLEGGQGYVLAERSAVGTGILRDLWVVKGRDQVLRDLVLSSKGVVRGILKYDDGAPIAGHELWCEPKTWEEAGPGRGPRGVLAGLNGGHVLTRQDGSFEIQGLKPGWYKIKPFVFGTVEGQERVFQVQTGQPPIEMRVACHRLRIRVFDPDGKRVLHSDCSLVGWRPDKDALVRRLAAGEPMSRGLDGDMLGSGQFEDCLVVRGSWWLVRCGDLGYSAERLVLADGAANETSVDLRLSLSKGPKDARLRVTVLSATDRRPMPFSLGLRRASLGVGPDQEEIESMDGTKVYRCNPGTFLAEIQPSPSRVFHSPSSYMKVHHLVKLESRQEAVLRVVAEQGGRLALLVHAPKAQTKPNERLVTVLVPASLGGKPRGLHPYIHEEIRGKQKSYIGFGAGPVNKRVLCKGLLSPGKHVLTVQTKGFKPKQVAVEIFAGKVTDAEVWLTEDDIETGKGR